MRRFKFTIEYDGRPFVGWQVQDNGPSIQSALELAIKQVTGETTLVLGAGRTDAGVHALAMVAHADIEKNITPFRLIGALNHYLMLATVAPAAVTVVNCEIVDSDFHARFSATKRFYEYRIVNRRAPLALERGFAWHVVKMLDHEAMHKAAQCLIGKHDFTTFRSVKCQSASPVKTLDRLDVQRWGDEIVITAEARSFLHHQVRSIVGCLKLVGERKWTARTLEKALQARDRNALGFNAPPDGLYFVKVEYNNV